MLLDIFSTFCPSCAVMGGLLKLLKFYCRVAVAVVREFVISLSKNINSILLFTAQFDLGMSKYSTTDMISKQYITLIFINANS